MLSRTVNGQVERQPWAPPLLFALMAAALLTAYFPTVQWLVWSWINKEDYSHGFIVPLISAYIVWQKRDALRDLPVTQSPLALPMVGLGLLLHILSVRAEVKFVSAYSLVLVIAGIIAFLFGRERLRLLRFPIAFLLLMIPVSTFILDPITSRLKLLSASLSAETIRSLGVPILRDGVMLHLANGSLEVANPCSGLRSIISLLTLGLIFAYFSPFPLWRRGVLVLATVPLAVAGNLARIIFLALILHGWGIVLEEGPLHTLSGLLVFAVPLIGLILVRRILR